MSSVSTRPFNLLLNTTNQYPHVYLKPNDVKQNFQQMSIKNKSTLANSYVHTLLPIFEKYISLVSDSSIRCIYQLNTENSKWIVCTNNKEDDIQFSITNIGGEVKAFLAKNQGQKTRELSYIQFYPHQLNMMYKDDDHTPPHQYRLFQSSFDISGKVIQDYPISAYKDFLDGKNVPTMKLKDYEGCKN